MLKYQVVFTNGNKINAAGSKAPGDVSAVAESLGFVPLGIDVRYKYTSNRLKKILSGLKSVFEWFRLYFRIRSNSVVLCQSPMTGGGALRDFILEKLRSRKGVKFIFLVHDVEPLRHAEVEKSGQDEFEFMLRTADSIIVHNGSMKKWFIEKQNVPEEKLVVLGIFDYIYPMKDGYPAYEKAVSIAGNLSLSKSAYLGYLKNLGTRIHLYGPNYSENLSSGNVVYKGSFPPGEIPYRLESGFGLIWDGTEIDTCSGEYGNYLRYNNPHKLSLYLASGLPVFIWKDAAEAGFVLENGAGYAIGSLEEIDGILSSLDEDAYRTMASNVHGVALRLSSGSYVREALSSALAGLEEKA